MRYASVAALAAIAALSAGSAGAAPRPSLMVPDTSLVQKAHGYHSSCEFGPYRGRRAGPHTHPSPGYSIPCRCWRGSFGKRRCQPIY